MSLLNRDEVHPGEDGCGEGRRCGRGERFRVPKVLPRQDIVPDEADVRAAKQAEQQTKGGRGAVRVLDGGDEDVRVQ